MRRAVPVAAVVACLLGARPAAAAPAEPHASWSLPALSNGFAAAVYDAKTGKLRDLFPHPYAASTPADATPDLLWDAFFGYSTGGGGRWFTAVPPLTVAYENGTGILTIVREAAGLRFTERWFAPMTAGAALVAGTLSVTNLGASPVTGLRLFSLHNFHVGVDDATPDGPVASSKAETLAWTGGGFVETGGASGRYAAAFPLLAPARHAATPVNPYQAVLEGGALQDGDGGPAQDDAVSAFQWDVATLEAGQEALVAGVVLGAGDDGAAEALRGAAAAWAGQGAAALDAERAWWKAYHARDALPDGLAGDDLALARQSLAFLAMSQVREPDGGGLTPHGQVLASLPPGQWNRTWVRDQAYATVALAATGHAAEAEAAVRFVLHGRAGGFEAEVGGPYLISMCRYWGGGDEESDLNVDGPNIEFDGFGLYLWAVHEVAARTGSNALAAEAWPQVKAGVADPLVALLEPGGLVKPDSGIWERHWNGQQKHFANTSITAVTGLCAAAALAEAAGDAASAPGYRAAARKVAAGIPAQLVTTAGVLAGNTEEMASGHALDAAAAEAFAWEVLDPAGPVATATFAAWAQGLAMKLTGRGYMRNDDGDWYDRQEWIFIDLRIASALRRAGRLAEAQALAGWVVAQSRANLGLIAELYTEVGADYAGAVPMGGFGAGAFLLWALDHRPAAGIAACLGPEPPADPGPEPVPEPIPEAAGDVAPEAAADVPLPPDTPAPPDGPADAAADPGVTPGRPGGSGGCAAGATGPAAVPALLALALAGLATRRRRPSP